MELAALLERNHGIAVRQQIIPHVLLVVGAVLALPTYSFRLLHKASTVRRKPDFKPLNLLQ